MTAAETIEELKETYLETMRLKDMAWSHLSAATLDSCKLKLGSRFSSKEAYSASGVIHGGSMSIDPTRAEKVYEVTHIWLEHNFHFGLAKAIKGGTFRLMAKAYPIKKDGTVASKGEFSIWDVEAAIKIGQIKLIVDSADQV